MLVSLRVRKTDDRVARVFGGRASAGVSLAGLCIVPYARRSCAAPAPRLQEAFAHWARFAKLRLRTHVVASQRLKVAGAVVAVPLVSFCVQRGGWRRSRTFYLAVVVSLNRPELMEDDRTPLPGRVPEDENSAYAVQNATHLPRLTSGGPTTVFLATGLASSTREMRLRPPMVPRLRQAHPGAHASTSG